MRRVIVCTVIVLCAVAVIAALLAGVWLGDYRWTLTGCIGLGAFVPAYWVVTALQLRGEL